MHRMELWICEVANVCILEAGGEGWEYAAGRTRVRCAA